MSAAAASRRPLQAAARHRSDGARGLGRSKLRREVGLRVERRKELEGGPRVDAVPRGGESEASAAAPVQVRGLAEMLEVAPRAGGPQQTVDDEEEPRRDPGRPAPARPQSPTSMLDLLLSAALVARFRHRRGPDPLESARFDTAALYAQHCASCHSANGDSKGTADLDRPARSFLDGSYSYGNTRKAVLRSVTYGIPGTPMPAFAETLGEEGLQPSPTSSSRWVRRAPWSSRARARSPSRTCRASSTG